MGRIWRPGRQTPKVKNGRVQKKHRWDYYFKEYKLREGDGEIPIVFEPAVRGNRHLVTEDQLRLFIGMIPNWGRYSEGLKCLVLGGGDDDCYGWHDLGVVCIHAWSSKIEEYWQRSFFSEHQSVLERLMVPVVEEQNDDEDQPPDVLCRFTQKTARGFLLMHVFLHELGHHYDRMMTKKRRHGAGGEHFAEDFSKSLVDPLWEKYFRVFGV